MKGFLKKIGKFLDGNKTVFGLLMYTAAPYLGAAGQIAAIVGAALAGGGAVHKAVKSGKQVKNGG